MRLERIQLRGFQSYREKQTVDIDRHLTLLAGRNNVGKSALLRALQVHVSNQDGAAGDFRLTYTWSVTADEIRAALPRSSARGRAAQDWILGGDDPQPLVATFVQPGHSGHTQPQALECARLELPSLNAVAQGEAGKTMGWTSGTLTGNTLAVAELQVLAVQAASKVLYLGPRRVEQGPRTFSQSTALEPDARNLADVLVHLYLNRRFGTFAAVEALMRSAFPGLKGIGVNSDAGPGSSHLMGEPQIYFDGRADPVPLRLCGTGLEQMLAIGVAVLSADEPRIVLVDEPQAYLHPHAERAMLALIAEHPQHQYVIATHSHLILRATPLRHARLLTLRDGATRVSHIEDQQAALGELGVSAADLWLVDRMLWVEGPSEQRVLALVAEHALSEAERVTLAIRRMPSASRFAAKSRPQAEATFRFCSEIVRAVSPLAVEMRFLFDADEKTPEFREQMAAVSGGIASFLPVRELENLFLDARLLHRGLALLCEQTEQPAPDAERVAKRLEELLGSFEDLDLYPQGPPDEDPRAVVRASRLLSTLWWELATAEYNKVEDGERLAALALELDPELLRPLFDVLSQLKPAG